jgi:hypothetical protein
LDTNIGIAGGRLFDVEREPFQQRNPLVFDGFIVCPFLFHNQRTSPVVLEKQCRMQLNYHCQRLHGAPG